MIITAGKYKGRKIETPDDKITRPTLSKTRMGVFNTLYSLIGDFNNKTFLDLFGGSGIIGLEAISRGFLKVKVFELNKHAARIIKQNYHSLGLIPDLTIGDSLKLLKNCKEEYDVIYIDPPYKCGLYEQILAYSNGGIIVVESSENIDFTGFKLLKQKKYGNSTISYLQKDL